MINLPSLTQLDRATSMRIWLCTGPTDMRRGFDRLAEQARQVTRQDPHVGHLFVFRSRGGDRLKALYWEKDGYVLWYKRLEEGTFKLPKLAAEQAAVELKASELAMLLDGIDLASVKRVKRYRRGAAPPIECDRIPQKLR
jgi:transposase